MFYAFIALAFITAILGVMAWRIPEERKTLGWATTVAGVVAFAALMISMFTIVGPSKQGIVVSLGKIQPGVLAEGPHFVLPWESVHTVYTGFDVAAANKSEGASHDQQVVHSDLTANYYVDPTKALELYRLLPSLDYEVAFVVPAMHEVFKAVMAQYTAEQLITERQAVSAAISTALNARLQQYHLKVQTVNLVNFGFSNEYNAAIEAKVTASQQAQTAERQKETTKFQAESRVLQARGEADAIRIQAEAIEKSGGAAYVQLQAVTRWDGKLPAYMTSGSTLPFINVK